MPSIPWNSAKSAKIGITTVFSKAMAKSVFERRPESAGRGRRDAGRSGVRNGTEKDKPISRMTPAVDTAFELRTAMPAAMPDARTRSSR